METAHPGCASRIRATRVTRFARTRPKAASGEHGCQRRPLAPWRPPIPDALRLSGLRASPGSPGQGRKPHRGPACRPRGSMHRPQKATGGSAKNAPRCHPPPPRSPDKAEGRIRGERMSASPTRAMETAHPGCASLIRATRATPVARIRPETASGTGMPAARIDASSAEGHRRIREERTSVSSSTPRVARIRPKAASGDHGCQIRPHAPWRPPIPDALRLSGLRAPPA
jgi:hypothetical protein